MNSEANVALLKRVYTSIKYHLEVLDLLISKISDLESQKRINELKSNYLRIQEVRSICYRMMLLGMKMNLRKF